MLMRLGLNVQDAINNTKEDILIECRDIDKLENYLELLEYELIEKLTEQDYLFVDKSEKELIKC